MTLYSSDQSAIPQASVPYWKQWQIVPNGTYLVTRILKPYKYPNASLATPYFRHSIPLPEWEKIRPELLAAYQEGKAIVIDAENGSISVRVSEEFDAAYERDKWGIKHNYEKKEDCFIPSDFDELSESAGLDENIPF